MAIIMGLDALLMIRHQRSDLRRGHERYMFAGEPCNGTLMRLCSLDGGLALERRCAGVGVTRRSRRRCSSFRAAAELLGRQPTKRMRHAQAYKASGFTQSRSLSAPSCVSHHKPCMFDPPDAASGGICPAQSCVRKEHGGFTYKHGLKIQRSKEDSTAPAPARFGGDNRGAWQRPAQKTR
jgi:hypothetical protein